MYPVYRFQNSKCITCSLRSTVSQTLARLRTCEDLDHGGLASAIGTQHSHTGGQGDVDGHIREGGLGGARVSEANLCTQGV